jgi:hypothetical protein
MDAHAATPEEFLSFVLGYGELLVARWQAQELRGPTPAAAVPYSRFRERRVPDVVLLWMMYQAHVEHLLPSPPGAGGTTALRPAASLQVGKASAFCLTDRGEEFGNDFLADALVPEDDGAFAEAWGRLLLGTLAPNYDRENRVFAWGRHMLKCFRQPAVNQELILSAAEEQGWPPWFDDPLPRRGGANPKVLLHNTINDLNRRQSVYLVHFRGDGTGRRIGWEHR